MNFASSNPPDLMDERQRLDLPVKLPLVSEQTTHPASPGHVPTPDDFGIGQLFWEIRDAVVVEDVESGLIVLWNPAAERLFGVTAEDAVGQSIGIDMPGLSPDQHSGGLAGYRVGGYESLIDAIGPVEVAARLSTGDAITVELSLSPITSRRLPGRFVLAIIRDATARNQAEADQLRFVREQAARTAAEMEAERQGEAAALLDTLLTAAPDGFALFDRDLRFVRVNQALAETNGIPVEAHLGRTLREVAPAMAATQEPLLRHVLATGESVCDLEVSGATRAGPGAERHWLVSYYPVQSRAGERFGVGAVLVEITARKRLEQMQQDFLTSVSHDLKNPLAALRLLTQLQRRRIGREAFEGSESISTVITRIEELTARMTAMVGELTDVAHLQVGQALALERVPTDVVALVRRSIEEHQKSTNRHRLTLQESESRLVGNWDPVRLERVLANLLSNAIKYSPDGGPITVGIEEDRTAAESCAVITIRDQGIGIPAADVPHIFERFKRGTNTAGRIAGTGIGLAGARQIVEQHGGTISVISREFAGSFFTIRLPLDFPGNSAQTEPWRSSDQAGLQGSCT